MFPKITLRRTRTAPTGYEKLRVLFHVLRSAQLLSSLIVGGIMIYFIWNLTHDHWSTPWTFVVLTIVSLLTVMFLSATIIFHCCWGLNTLLNLCLNATLCVLWGMGFGMLSWYMWGTLTHMCDVGNWHDSTGVHICRTYKALFTFALLGNASTIGALALDLHIRRLDTQRGKHFRLTDLEQKRRVPATRGPYTDEDHHVGHRSSEETLSRHSEAFDVPTRGYGAQPNLRAQGYAVPESQFEYDGYDTGYHGAHAERVFGAEL